MTGFSDEISADLDEQLDVLDAENIRFMELRSVWGINVLQLSEQELNKVAETLTRRNVRVSSIASPIGKYAIQDSFVPQLDDMHKAINIAKRFQASFIRLFSYFIPEGEATGAYRNEVMLRMNALVALAAEAGVTLILENDCNMYGTTDELSLDILHTCESPYLKHAFDPGNFVINGINPANAFHKLAQYVDYFHIKDATRTPAMFVAAGAGDGELESLLQALKKRNYSGFLSVEPHLHDAFPEQTAPQQFATAAQALKRLLAKLEMSWQ